MAVGNGGFKSVQQIINQRRYWLGIMVTLISKLLVGSLSLELWKLVPFPRNKPVFKLFLIISYTFVDILCDDFN